MISTSEKKLYKILRNIGVKPKKIRGLNKIEDLYLDDFDFQLLVNYFEHEFKIQLKDREIIELIDLQSFYHFINRKAAFN